MLLFLLAAACDGPQTEAAEGPAVPLVAIGDGGGMTGLHKGCRVDSSGTISAFRALGAGVDSTIWTRVLTPEERQRLRAAVDSPGAADWVSQETGNITSWASLTTDTGSQRWTWSGRAMPLSAPEPFVTWVSITRELCRP